MHPEARVPGVSRTVRHRLNPHLLAASLLSLAIGSCDNSTDGWSPVAIESPWWAEFAAVDVVELCMLVRDDLTKGQGSYNGERVAGDAGTATVSGTVSGWRYRSCGTDCITSGNSVRLEIMFDRFAVTTTTTTTTLNGTVLFTDNTWSQQSGLSYFSGGSICVQAQGDLSYRFEGKDAAGRFGASGTITYLSSCGNEGQQSGTLSTKSQTFSF